MTKPTKRSIAVVIRNGDRVLSMRRPDTDDELPGIWGLPAGSYRPGETTEDLIRRIGRDKLGVDDLAPIRRLAAGTQDRPLYLLDMELWEVRMTGLPRKSTWQWAEASILELGKQQGSLCCDLALGVL